MVLLIGSTGLRRSEMIALTWLDLNTRTMEVNILRSCVRNRFGKTKTESSRRPVPLHPLVLSALLEWRAQSPYATDVDFLFPSTRFKGSKPLSPDSILEKSIRPALARIGVIGKQIGWHSFRHSLATNLRSLGVDIKVAQELMRHSSCRTTLDIYTRAVSQQKREASLKVVELMLPLDLKKFQHPSAPSETEETPNQHLQRTHCRRFIGGPDRDRTDDLFHAMEARSQLRHRPTSSRGQLSYFRRSGPIRQTGLPQLPAQQAPPTRTLAETRREPFHRQPVSK